MHDDAPNLKDLQAMAELESFPRREVQSIQVIKLRAMPKKRARTFTDKVTKKTRTAHEPKYSKWKEQMGWLLRAAFPGQHFKGALCLHLWFGFDKANLSDIDNLAGGIMDAANGVLWDDDRCIKELHVVIDNSKREDFVAIAISNIEDMP